MTRRARRPQQIGDIAEKTIQRLDVSGKRHGAKVVEKWERIAGPEINKHTLGFAFRESQQLVVFVDTGIWANELSLMAGDLMKRINNAMGEEAVKSLRFTVSKRVSERDSGAEAMCEDESADEYWPQAAELDEVERMQAAHIASAVPDPELREIALRVMMKDLAIKKGTRLARIQKAAAGSAGHASREEP